MLAELFSSATMASLLALNPQEQAALALQVSQHAHSC